ncbi:MAG: amidohydrolase family protein, partial [Sphaerochaeta sp.]|nr:amidohydrolase family protein [Sphaerochaeta sp.]
MKTLFKNAFIITSTGITSGEVLVNGSSIEKVSFGCSIDGKVDKVVDVQGLYLSPGFIDVHTHGAGGADFMDGNLESIYTACRMHLRHGTTSIVPTTITSTKQSLYDFIDLFNQVDLHAPDCPNILGLHLEGPYFSYDQRGAQDP